MVLLLCVVVGMGGEVDDVLVLEVVVAEVDEVLVEVVGCEVEALGRCEVDEGLVMEVVVDVVSGLRLRVVCGWEVVSVWVEGNSDVRIVVISSDSVNE